MTIPIQPVHSVVPVIPVASVPIIHVVPTNYPLSQPMNPPVYPNMNIISPAIQQPPVPPPQQQQPLEQSLPSPQSQPSPILVPSRKSYKSTQQIPATIAPPTTSIPSLSKDENKTICPVNESIENSRKSKKQKIEDESVSSDFFYKRIQTYSCEINHEGRVYSVIYKDYSIKITNTKSLPHAICNINSLTSPNVNMFFTYQGKYYGFYCNTMEPVSSTVFSIAQTLQRAGIFIQPQDITIRYKRSNIRRHSLYIQGIRNNAVLTVDGFSNTNSLYLLRNMRNSISYSDTVDSTKLYNLISTQHLFMIDELNLYFDNSKMELKSAFMNIIHEMTGTTLPNLKIIRLFMSSLDSNDYFGNLELPSLKTVFYIKYDFEHYLPPIESNLKKEHTSI